MGVNRVRYFESHHSATASGMFRAVVVLHHLLRSADQRHRFAARIVASRASWATLPSAPAPASRGSSPVGHGEFG
jgi:hypothetical protein